MSRCCEGIEAGTLYVYVGNVINSAEEVMFFCPLDFGGNPPPR